MSRSLVAQLLLRAAAAAGAISAPSALYAEAPTAFTAAALGKSSAILGRPTRLSEVLAQQGSSRAPDTATGMRPASYSRPILHHPTPRAAQRGWTGAPDVFGSVALKLSRTPLDRHWESVATVGLVGAHARFARSLRGLEAVERLQRVNSYVNQRVRFVDDSPRLRGGDVWTTAAETLRRGKGDCEDYAIAKMQLLREARISTDDLYLVLVKDLARRTDHAVLVVRVENRTLLLDNGTDRLVESETVGDYRPVFTFAASGSWTHGYRRSLAPPLADATASIAGLPALPQR